jgi:hypothetical protein
MFDKQQLHHLVDQLREAEWTAAARYLEFLLSHEAPIDAEMLARIDQARALRSMKPSPTMMCFGNSGFEAYTP